MQPFTRLSSRTVLLPAANIDTDQIIPARFLTTTGRTGFGARLFADWRYDAAGAPRADFALNRPEAQGCQILVAGRNFGCGSSREHAPWALVDFGIRAVVSTEIADIFTSNALKNGLLPVVVDEPTSAWLLANPGAHVTIDVATRTLTLPSGGSARFPLEPFAQHCLLQGVDELGYLLAREPEIAAYEVRHADGVGGADDAGARVPS
jgi:3-isopropylmalate/(R)-2-methylmalate dehydratase small subunit